MFEIKDKQQLFTDTKLLLLGKKTRAPSVQTFLDELGKALDVRVVNVGLDRIRWGTTQRLWVYVERFEEKEKLMMSGFLRDKAKEKIAADRFFDRWREACALAVPPVVEFRAFDQDAIEDAIKAVPQARLDELEAANGLWKISRLYPPAGLQIFYPSEKAWREAVDKGTVTPLENDVFALVKREDALGYVTRKTVHVVSDTKERFDRVYHGSWRAYYD
jgi:hypothetical protein